MRRLQSFQIWIFLLFLFTGSTVSTASETALVYDLEKMWEIEGNDEELIIGWIDDAVVDKTGRFYLLDSQLSQILVIDGSGELVSTIGGEGDAPGEFRNAASIAWWKNGLLAVSQNIPGRLKLISVDGLPGETIHYLRSGETQVTNIWRFEPFSGGFMIHTSSNSANGKSVFSDSKLVRCENGGEEIETLKEHALTQHVDNFIMDEKLVTPIWGEWVCKNNGAVVWVNDREKYSLYCQEPGGLPEIFFERDYRPLPRSNNEVSEIKEFWEADVREYFGNVKAIIEKNDPAVIRLLHGPADQIWAVTSRNFHAKNKGSLLLAEVHNSDGSCRGTVEMVLPKGMVGGEVLVLDGTFVLARFQKHDDGSYPEDPYKCRTCVPVYAAFKLQLH